VYACCPQKKNIEKTLPPIGKKCIFIGMKKLSLFLAMACLIASNSFADSYSDKGAKEFAKIQKCRADSLCAKRSKVSEKSDEECSKYEIKGGNVVYRKNGEIVDGVGESLSIFSKCKDRLRGYKEEVQKTR
jgi:hypothetical protein